MAFKIKNPFTLPGDTKRHNKIRNQQLKDSKRNYEQAKYDFEANPDVMAKRAGFTMKGFTYPGTSPNKNVGKKGLYEESAALQMNSAFKQEGPIDRKNPKRKPSELEGTWIYGRGYDEEDTAGERGAGFEPGKGKDEKFTAIERINDIEDRISFIKEDISNQEGGATKQQKKDLKELEQELAIMRKRYKNETKKKK